MNILIPTDFSPHTANALAYAVQIAEQTKAQLHVLHAYHVPIINQNAWTPVQTLVERSAKIASIQFSNQLKKGLSNIDLSNVSFKYHSTKHIEARSILQTVKQQNIDFLVLGTQASPPLLKVLFGNEVEHVIDRSKNCTILAVPERATYRSIQEIVYATSLNAPEGTLAQLRNFARLFGATVKFVHILEEKTRSYTKRLHHFKQKVQQVFERNTYKIITVESPYIDTALNNYVLQHGIDMVSMVERPKNILDRLFINSITKKMAFDSTVPVLILYEQNGTFAMHRRRRAKSTA